MIKLDHVSKSFKKKQALDDISFSFGKGVYGLLGPNGAGKTTLMRCITDIYPDYKGTIRFDGKALADDKTLSRRIGYLPQKLDMFRELTLLEMMEYFAALKHLDKAQQARQIADALEFVNLTENKNDRLGSFSGGMVRRAGIAQAILGDPGVILVDEPTAGLDPEERLRFKNVIARLGGQRLVLLSTHIIEDVEALCSHIVIMHGGKIRASGTPDEIAGLAAGHVFTCVGAALPVDGGETCLIRQSEENGAVRSRFLARENHGWEAAAPTIEDGYMFVIKGMGA